MLLFLCTRFSKICCEFYTGIESQFGLSPFKCPLATVAIILDNTHHCGLGDSISPTVFLISSPLLLAYCTPAHWPLHCFLTVLEASSHLKAFGCAGVLVLQTSMWIPCSYPLLCSNVTSSLGLYWFVRAAITHTMDQVASRREIVKDQGVSSTGLS